MRSRAKGWAAIAAVTLMAMGATAFGQEDREERVKALRAKLVERFGDDGAQVKAVGEVLREDNKARRARFTELKNKESSGGLDDDEKKELAAIKASIVKVTMALQKLEASQGKVEADLAKRIETRRKELVDKWGPWIVERDGAKQELDKHARRMAFLERSKALVELEDRKDMVAHINNLVSLETERHGAAMASLKGSEEKGK